MNPPAVRSEHWDSYDALPSTVPVTFLIGTQSEVVDDRDWRVLLHRSAGFNSSARSLSARGTSECSTYFSMARAILVGVGIVNLERACGWVGDGALTRR
jgi:hypothetical protein